MFFPFGVGQWGLRHVEDELDRKRLGREARRLLLKVLAITGTGSVGREDTEWKLFPRKNCMIRWGGSRGC